MAASIVAASLYYTNRLASKLAKEERKKMEQVVEAIKVMSDPNTTGHDLTFAGSIVQGNTTIPFLVVDDSGEITQNINIDTFKIARNPNFLTQKMNEFKAMHPPIVVELGYGLGNNYIYHGESYLLSQLRYFPYVQLAIIILFLLVVLIALSSAHRSIQNQVWVGLSKETAHQLGTPLTSIEGWVELLKEDHDNEMALTEMQKDLDRLKLVADRFGKVGSVPTLHEENLIDRLKGMVDYMQKRAPAKVSISLDTKEDNVPVNISAALFDWVLENLLRNALDAMEGKGEIKITVDDQPHDVRIDVSDTGKGIPRHQIKRIFKPGFTTKKRGWGLGLSLSKRIIDRYHNGSLLVKSSEVGKGTTFRIILRR
ncbi:MAG: HAMP domain-containing histidine kinase [Chitinophagales bacterium]|nr:HAMP domain-containing histidine kinase [Chitinophagales bacterium]